MNLELDGKAALVAGGSRGIGRAIALGLAREGARVCVVARASDGGGELAATLADLTAAGPGPHTSCVADVATADGADAAIAHAVATFGALDVVVANVGKSFARTAQTMDDADLTSSLDTNLWSAARIAQRAAPHLRGRDGSITLISSVFGREAGGAPGYNVAKAAVIALGKALARDYAADGIRVNSVAPGSIVFPGSGWDRRQKADPEGIAAFVARELPFGRFGTADEVADVVVFLASARARWVSGACIPVDGVQGRSF
ncbi:MAG: SDR family oxidoreductase [Kofleriaceae bacterium]